MSYADAMEDQIKALVAEKAELMAALVNLVAMIEGECPSLCDDCNYERASDAIAKHEAKP